MVNHSLRRLGIESAWNIPPGCGKGEQSKQQQQQRESLCHAAADQRHPDSVHQLELCFRSCRFPSLCGRLGRWHILRDANTLHSGKNESALTLFKTINYLLLDCCNTCEPCFHQFTGEQLFDVVIHREVESSGESTCGQQSCGHERSERSGSHRAKRWESSENWKRLQDGE